MKLLEASWGHLGGILGTFRAHFGGPERTWKKMPYKGGGLFSWSRFLQKNAKQIGIFAPEKASKIGLKMAPNKVAKKVTPKSYIFTFFY